MCEKLTIYPYGQYIVENVFSFAFRQYSQIQDRNGGLREMCKNITVVTVVTRKKSRRQL